MRVLQGVLLLSRHERSSTPVLLLIQIMQFDSSPANTFPETKLRVQAIMAIAMIVTDSFIAIPQFRDGLVILLTVVAIHTCMLLNHYTNVGVWFMFIFISECLTLHINLMWYCLFREVVVHVTSTMHTSGGMKKCRFIDI